VRQRTSRGTRLALVWRLLFNGLADSVSTQFFERQEVQRKYTRFLLGGFVTAILLVVIAINLVVLIGLGGDPVHVAKHEPWVIFWISLIVLGTILIASWHRSSQLRQGGAVVARSLGGIQINGNDPDLARKRLVNIVEEMAIAARVRKPQIFVLPDESCINAFAAGNSPDEAAVAVTQGALERLDRDQLQAVIGHEFSHVLNGDMKLNMRLTACIFGLFVITDIARRILRGRSRGKAAGRLKLIALGIWIAGSVGMLAGRLLQAGVSRRREHLADASAVQFTRNPQALQGAFITMAAHADGSRLLHPASAGCAHMFFAASDPSWANKIGGSWFATHPSIEERVSAIDARVTPIKFRTLVGDERRKIATKEKSAAQEAAQPEAGSEAAAGPGAIASAMPLMPVLAMQAAIPGELSLAATGIHAAPVAAGLAKKPVTATISTGATGAFALAPEETNAETLPSGVRMVGGRALPPDTMRNRISLDAQNALTQFVAQTEKSTNAVQAVLVAAMLASEPAKWRTQLTKLAPALGIELFKETPTQIARLAQLPPAARLPALMDLFTLFDTMDPAHRKRLRAVARAFAPTVATGDMLRFAITRMLEKKLGKTAAETPPVPLPDRAPAVCEIYAALSQCRFGAGRQGMNAYRAGVMGMLTPQKWSPYPDDLVKPAALDAALAAVSQVHPTGKRSFSEGLARVIAVGGRLTVPQIELLRATCVIVDCAVPLIPIDVTFDESDVMMPAQAASAR
jgi:Zn-dependent protease with chaperone function